MHINDYLSQFRRQLDSKLDTLNTIINVMSDKFDMVSELDWTDNEYVLLPYTGRSDLESILNVISNKTIISPEGYVDSFHYESFDASGFLYDSGNQVVLSWVKIRPNPDDPDYIRIGEPVFHNFSEGYAFQDLFGYFSEQYSENGIILNAIDLAQSGNYNVANFMSACSPFISKMRPNVAKVVDTLKQGLLTVTEQSQASCLINSLRSVWAPLEDATSDGRQIVFSETEYSISSSIFLPISDVISLASTVLGGIMTLISPIVGLVVSGIGMVVGKIVDAINRNDGIYCKVVASDQRDHNGYAQPLIQHTLPIEDLGSIDGHNVLVPGNKVYDILDKYGYVKISNAMFTCYLWFVNPDTKDELNIEIFINASLGLAYWVKTRRSTQIDIIKKMSEAVTVSSNPNVGYTINWEDYAVSLTEARAWINEVMFRNATHQGFDYVNWGLDNLSNDNLNGTLMVSQMFNYAMLFYLISIYGDFSYSGYTFSGTGSPAYWRTAGNLKSAPKFNGENAVGVLLCFLEWIRMKLHTETGNYNPNPDTFDTDLSYFNLDNWLSEEFVYNGDFRDDYKWFNDNVIPAFRSWIKNMGLPVAWTNVIFDHFYNEDFCDVADFTDPDTLGYRGFWMVSTSVRNNANCYVYPITSTVSLWMQIAIAAVLTTVAVVTAAVVTTKVKRKLQYKAWTKRQELTKLTQAAQASGNYDDWNAARRATNRYNRFLGKITGNTFDMNNAWLDYNTSAYDAQSGVFGNEEIIKLITGN